MLRLLTAGRDERRRLSLVGKAPDRVAQFVLVEELEPLRDGPEVDLARAVRLGEAALGNEDGQAGFERLAELLTQVPPMGRGVEVEGVHDVPVPAQGAAHGRHEVLVAVRCAHYDDGARVVCPDNGDDFLGVVADLRPRGVSSGLVAYLVDDVGRLRVLRGHLREELGGLLSVLVWVVVLQDMPIHQHVHVRGDGRVDARAQCLHEGGHVLGVCLAVVLGIDGQADHVGVPFGRDLPEERRVRVLAEPLQAVGAHAP